MQPNIAIIGAGIAGLSCATVLQQAGVNVTVFEKSRGVSGRLSTRVFEQSIAEQSTAEQSKAMPAWQCDHGAQYFTARDPLFNAEVLRWAAAGVAQLWQPRLQVFDGNTFLPKAGKTARFVGYPSNNSPAKWLAKALHVQAETTVIGLQNTCLKNPVLQKNNQQWQLNTKEHGVLPQLFDEVLLAIPAPQAAVLLNQVAPALADLSASVNMQPCFSVMVQLNQTLNCPFDGLFINNGLLSWIARDSAKPGRKAPANSTQETWILHASSQWSESHVNDDKAAVAHQMLAAFIALVNIDNATLHNSATLHSATLHSATLQSSNIQSHTLHRWLYADCVHYLTCGYQLDLTQRIGLCGDWLNGGKVQGAWLSGYGLAQQVLQNSPR